MKKIAGLVGIISIFYCFNIKNYISMEEFKFFALLLCFFLLFYELDVLIEKLQNFVALRKINYVTFVGIIIIIDWIILL